MLVYSMGVSVDGFIADREGAFGWTTPSEEQFRFHLAQVRELGGCLLGRRLYETLLVWETDPSLRDNELGAAFADVWCALPKVVFSSRSTSVSAGRRPDHEPGPGPAVRAGPRGDVQREHHRRGRDRLQPGAGVLRRGPRRPRTPDQHHGRLLGHDPDDRAQRARR